MKKIMIIGIITLLVVMPMVSATYEWYSPEVVSSGGWRYGTNAVDGSIATYAEVKTETVITVGPTGNDTYESIRWYAYVPNGLDGYWCEVNIGNDTVYDGTCKHNRWIELDLNGTYDDDISFNFYNLNDNIGYLKEFELYGDIGGGGNKTG